MGILDRSSAACELAEEPAKVVHSNCHRADGSLSGDVPICGIGVFDLEWPEAAGSEQASSVKVVCQPAETRFPGREEAVYQSSVRACSGHDREVADLAAVCNLAHRNRLRRAVNLL